MRRRGQSDLLVDDRGRGKETDRAQVLSEVWELAWEVATGPKIFNAEFVIDGGHLAGPYRDPIGLYADAPE